MRCKNCGWENSNGLTKCEKCNTPLSGAVNNQPVYGTMQEIPQATPLNKTVCEAVVFPKAATPVNNICPNCGYPMRPGVTDCPNCHQQATQQDIPQPAFNIQQAPKAVKANSTQGTVNPWVQVAPANKCSLQPIEQQGVETPEILKLKGDSHNLNRENLDPENQTITSKVQAQLVCEDGQWYIQDKSAQHTTFIYAGEKTALKDGDVILMGNRQFIFHID